MSKEYLFTLLVMAILTAGGFAIQADGYSDMVDTYNIALDECLSVQGIKIKKGE